MTRRIAIVGAGISGLTAAYRVRQALGGEARIDVYEAGSTVGGLLRTVDVGGRAVDVGAEAFIVRRPEAVELIRELGLHDRVVAPTGRRPAVWAGDRLYPLPLPALMGIPAGPEVVAGLAEPGDVERMSGEQSRPLQWRPGDDPSVGELVGDRFGPSVVARSVDPMLGGVYSSLAADIGVREALPALAGALDAGAPSLTAAVGELTSRASGAGPVFGTLVGGYTVLVDALINAAGIEPTTCSYVGDLRPVDAGWSVEVERGRHVVYDGVVLAMPAWQAGHILRQGAPEISAPLQAVARASSVVVSIALEPGTAVPDHSGVLVATGDTLRAKAFTFSSQKWAHLGGDDGPVSVRASFGRYRAPVPEDRVEQGVDDRIVTEALEDLDAVCRAAGVPAVSGRVRATYVQRWSNGLPVYGPGHLATMAEVTRSLPHGLVLAGSSYAGVGVPACIGQAGRAVSTLLDDLI